MQKGFKEWLRKKIVYLKRNTRIITMLWILISCFVFTLKMSDHSQAIMRAPDSFRISSLVFFIVTLLSFMGIFTFSGFKRFNKKNILPLAITLGVLVTQLLLDIFLVNGFYKASQDASSYASFFIDAYKWLTVHIVCISITIITVPCLPLISKLLGMIDVSVPEEKNQQPYITEQIVDGSDV